MKEAAMENQHRKITGYRELTEVEINAMNIIKARGEQLAQLLDDLGNLPDVDKRALAIARTEFQTGLMWATRAVARPTNF
ncbi:MAG: hypothetical protein ACK5TQ_10350 [Acetobacteraceae bacterium]